MRRSPKTARARVDAGVKERNEMTVGRTEDPKNPIRVTASPKPPYCLLVWTASDGIDVPE
jgi:hypothetical protein